MREAGPSPSDSRPDPTADRYVFSTQTSIGTFTRRLARVVEDGTGQACRPPEFQGDPIAAGTIEEREVMGDDARSGHPHRERIDRRREIRKRGHPIGTAGNRQALQPIVGSLEQVPAVECTKYGRKTDTRKRTVIGTEDRQGSWQRLSQGQSNRRQSPLSP